MKLKTMILFAGIMLASFTVNAATRVSLLGQDSDIIVNISGVSEIGEALKKTSFGNLWNDPEFKNPVWILKVIVSFQSRLREVEKNRFRLQFIIFHAVVAEKTETAILIEVGTVMNVSQATRPFGSCLSTSSRTASEI